MTMPENTNPPAQTTTPSSNAPAFVPADTMQLAQQLSRLNSDLEAERQRTAQLTQQLQAQATSANTATLEQQLAEAKAEAARARQQLETVTNERTTEQRTAALTGKVSDVNLALKVLDPAKHLNADGSVNTVALMADFPALAPAGVTQQTAPDGAGGTQTASNAYAPNLEAAVKSGDPAAINAAMDAQLAAGRGQVAQQLTTTSTTGNSQ